MLTAEFPAIPVLLVVMAEWLSCCVVVFPQKKRGSDIRTAGYMLCYLVVLLLEQHYVVITGTRLAWAIGIAVNVLLLILTVYRVCKMILPGAILWGMYSFSLAELLGSAGWQIATTLSGSDRMLHPENLLCLIAVFLGLLVPILMLLRRMEFSLMDYSWMSALVASVLVISIFYLSNLGLIHFSWEKVNALRFSLGLNRTLSCLCSLALMTLMVLLLYEHGQKKESAAISAAAELQYQQYLNYQENNEYIARQCHDLKHQVDALKAACSEEERATYLQELETAIRNYNAYSKTGNAVVDSILTQKILYCMQHEIQFVYSVSCDALSCYPVRDVCIIIGNLLDNAIEHVSELPSAEEKQILFDVFQKNQFVIVRVENCCRGVSVTGDALPETTKQDRQMHGYGLKSVQRTVSKHKGILHCTVERNWFVVQALLPLEF